MLDLKFHAVDNGFCRVMYRANGRLYCMQIKDMRTKDFELLSCSRDWEPSCRIKPGYVTSIEPPEGDESTAIELRAYLNRTALDQINVEN